MPPRQLYDASFKFLRETERAICVTEDDKVEIWLPKSQIEYERDFAKGLVEVTMPVWLAKEKGIV